MRCARIPEFPGKRRTLPKGGVAILFEWEASPFDQCDGLPWASIRTEERVPEPGGDFRPLGVTGVVDDSLADRISLIISSCVVGQPAGTIGIGPNGTKADGISFRAETMRSRMELAGGAGDVADDPLATVALVDGDGAGKSGVEFRFTFGGGNPRQGRMPGDGWDLEISSWWRRAVEGEAWRNPCQDDGHEESASGDGVRLPGRGGFSGCS